MPLETNWFAFPSYFLAPVVLKALRNTCTSRQQQRQKLGGKQEETNMKNHQLVLSCYCSTITLLFITPAMQSHGCSVQVEHLFSFSTFGFPLLFGSVKKKTNLAAFGSIRHLASICHSHKSSTEWFQSVYTLYMKSLE